MNSKFSETVKFIVGVLVMYVAWQLHTAGVFTRIGTFLDFSGRNNFGGVTDVLLGVLPVVVDAVCVVGSISLAFFGLCWKALRPLCLKLAVLLDKKLEGYGVDLYEVGGVYAPPAVKGLDVDKLSATLQDIADRLELVEQGYSK